MTPLRRWLAGGAAAVVFLGGGLLSWILASRGPPIPGPSSPDLVEHGKVVYAHHCASCHGAHLEGQPNWRVRLPNGRLPAPPHDVTGHTWHHSDKQLFDMVKNGTAGIVPGYETDMLAYKDTLSDGEIWAVLSFIESTWPPEIRQRQQRINRGAQ